MEKQTIFIDGISLINKFDEKIIENLKKICVHHINFREVEKINLIYTIAGIYGEIFDHYPSINERTKVLK
ncbi:hypothetical protein DERF_008194 [Dermatophagoides farinae]|uniref:Uncharacterized protein n=1 Tax=Dermatophagoides farinae TaxID=6954 RepID=A0A922HZT0_DERFA|nr:hypothetical protein DERF_008194 [Dermatophagoides farinae]